MRRARCRGRVQSFHAPWRPTTSQRLHVFPNPVPWGFYGGFITPAWLIKPLAVGDWTQSPALHPQDFGAFQKSLTNIRKDTLPFSTLRKFHWLGELWVGNRDGVHIYICKINHNKTRWAFFFNLMIAFFSIPVLSKRNRMWAPCAS